MKKLLILFIAALAMSACTEDKENRVIKDFVVNSNSWDFINSNGNRFAYSFYFPELSNFLYNNGSIAAYIETIGNSGEKRQQILPYVESRQIGTRKYIRTIDYDYTDRGDIAFYVTHSDFIYDGTPETMRFRVVIIW